MCGFFFLKTNNKLSVIKLVKKTLKKVLTLIKNNDNILFSSLSFERQKYYKNI